jgi:3-phenylpropionate/trans-cinnamate dioxygenase ferredoxin reductase subunit
VTNHLLAILGAGLAGAKAAEGVREAGYDGRNVLIGEEPHAPYERPPLFKAVLRGDADIATARVHPERFYIDHQIELIHDRAVALDPVARRINLEGGAAIPFDSAVLATGARPRRLHVPGAELPGVHCLRTADDAVFLCDAICGASRIAVIGAGWIGTEVAASARQMRTEVVLIDAAPVPRHRVLGVDIGSVFAHLHADHGAELRLGVGITELVGTTTVERLVLDDATVIDADVVVVGVGVTPRTDAVDSADGISLDNGIIVNEHLETEVPGIYADGAVANAWHPHYGRHLRVEHWANALNQGTTAGRQRRRPARLLRPAALLLLRPIRPRHGIHRPH